MKGGRSNGRGATKSPRSRSVGGGDEEEAAEDEGGGFVGVGGGEMELEADGADGGGEGDGREAGFGGAGLEDGGGEVVGGAEVAEEYGGDIGPRHGAVADDGDVGARREREVGTVEDEAGDGGGGGREGDVRDAGCGASVMPKEGGLEVVGAIGVGGPGRAGGKVGVVEEGQGAVGDEALAIGGSQGDGGPAWNGGGGGGDGGGKVVGLGDGNGMDGFGGVEEKLQAGIGMVEDGGAELEKLNAFKTDDVREQEVDGGSVGVVGGPVWTGGEGAAGGG